jgi:hypothetical protein
MPFDLYHLVTQCSIVVQQYYHIFPSHHHNKHSAWQHAIGVSWVSLTANPVNISQLTNNMWIQPCYGITIVMLYNAGWFWDGHTTYFLHTTLMSTLQDALHGHLVSWDPAATANHANISPLPNNMWIQPCRFFSTIWLHNAVLLLNSNTTYFLHTVIISTLHDSMP